MNPSITDAFKRNSTLEMSHISKNPKVSNLSKVACDQRIQSLHSSQLPPDKIYWSAESFGLDRSELYQGLSEAAKLVALQTLSSLRLSLAWYIEKVGLAYCSRALLECDSHEEKRLYALMAADEAVHQRMIEHFLPSGEPIPELEQHPLLLCIADVIENASSMAAVYIVQILLEGFGMQYYSQFKSKSLSPAVSAAFDQILKDEARHHGGGLARFQNTVPTAETIREISKYTHQLVCAMEGIGFTIIAIEKALGRMLSANEKEQLLLETEWTRQAPTRLRHIRELIKRHDFFGIYESLHLEENV